MTAKAAMRQMPTAHHSASNITRPKHGRRIADSGDCVFRCHSATTGAPRSVPVDEHHDRNHGQRRDGECTPDPLHEVLGRVVAVPATNSLPAICFSEEEQERAVESDQDEQDGVESVHA
jgi:hypothetical protein